MHTSQSADVWTVSYSVFILFRYEFWILIPKYELQQNIVCSVHPCSIIEGVPCPFEYVQCKSVPISCQSPVQVTTWEQFDRFLMKFVAGKSKFDNTFKSEQGTHSLCEELVSPQIWSITHKFLIFVWIKNALNKNFRGEYVTILGSCSCFPYVVQFLNDHM